MDTFITTLMQFVPLGILAAVFGATYMLGQMFTDPKTKEPPNWLVAVPFLLGGALGTANYFTLLDPTALAAKPFWVNLISAILMGAGYGGAEVLLWTKVAKKIFANDGITDVPPQPEKPSVPPVVLPLIFLALLLVASPVHAQKVLGLHGGSDSVAVACDSNWCGNVYTFSLTDKKGFLWIKNLGSAGDLLFAEEYNAGVDTTAMVGAFSRAKRIEPGGDRIFPINCKKLRIKAARKGTTVPFWFDVTPTY